MSEFLTSFESLQNIRYYSMRNGSHSNGYNARQPNGQIKDEVRQKLQDFSKRPELVPNNQVKLNDQNFIGIDNNKQYQITQSNSIIKSIYKSGQQLEPNYNNQNHQMQSKIHMDSPLNSSNYWKGISCQAHIWAQNSLNFAPQHLSYIQNQATDSNKYIKKLLASFVMIHGNLSSSSTFKEQFVNCKQLFVCRSCKQKIQDLKINTVCKISSSLTQNVAKVAVQQFMKDLRRMVEKKCFAPSREAKFQVEKGFQHNPLGKMSPINPRSMKSEISFTYESPMKK